jgi:hypothetical protein
MHPSATHLAGRTALQLLAVLAMLAALLAPMLIGTPALADEHAGIEGYIIFSYEGEKDVVYFDVATQSANVTLEGYAWDVNSDGEPGSFHLSCSETLVGTTATVLGPPSPFPAGETATIVGYDSTRVTGGGTIQECQDGETPEDPDPAAMLTVLKAFDPVDAGDEADYQATVGSTDVGWGDANTFDPGSYLIAETYTGEGDDPLQLQGISCVDDTEATVDYDAETGVTLADGDDVTCTLTNVPVPTEPDPEPSSLTLLKQVINDNGGEAVFSDFTPTVTDGEGADAIEGVAFQAHDAESTMSYTIEPGTYTLGETGSAAYELTSLTCEGGTFDSETNQLTIAEGEDVTCTFVNDDEEPEVQDVVIEKPEDPAPDPDPAPEVESEELAQTGLDAPWLAVLSALFLALGTALLRRTAPLTRTVRRLGS